MPNPQMPTEGSPAEEQGENPAAEAQEGAQGKSDQPDPSKVISAVQQALAGIAQATQGAKGVPPEAQKHIENAMNEYNAFMQLMGSAIGAPIGGDQAQASLGNQSSDAAGVRGAVPADQPTRAGAKPMMG